MNTSGEAADQVLRMTLEGTEAALKITGKGAEKITVLLYKMLKDLAKESNKTQGQMRLANMIKSGKKLEIFEIPDANLKKFCEMAKTYGVVYTVLKDKNQDDGKCEIMVKADDSQKINHILRRMEIVVENTGTVETDADKVKEEYYKEHPEKARTEEGGEPGEPERASMEKSEEDKFLDELMSIKQSRTSIEDFEKLLVWTGYSIVQRTFWVINPHYKQKFHLCPIRLCPIFALIPYVRNYYITSVFYLLN